MELRTRATVLTVVVVLGYLGASALLAWSTAGLLAAGAAPGPDRLDVLVGLAASVAAWLVLTWLAAASALAVTAAAFSAGGSRLERAAERLTPALLRRVAAVALGAGLAGVPLVAALPAHAEHPAGRAPVATAPAAAPVVTALDVPALDRPVDTLTGWTPDRPAAPAAPRRDGPVHLVATTPRPELAVVEEVVVRRGDTLWDVAARHLGPQASAAEVAAEWPRWHAANRDLVGPDPDLIRPGQRLQPP